MTRLAKVVLTLSACASERSDIYVAYETF